MNITSNRTLATSIAGLLLILAANANATPISVTGQGQILLSAPASTDSGSPDPDVSWQLGFVERTGVLLEDPLLVDGGSIAAGTVVDSTMIFFETALETKSYAEATWSFAGLIIGLMTDSDGSLMAASDGLLGAAGTYYPGGSPNRGTEGRDWWSVSPDGHVLDLGLWVLEPGDWIRVVTTNVEPTLAVPEPGVLALIAGCLLGLGLIRRRRLTTRLQG